MKDEIETDNFLKKVNKAREAILTDLANRFKAGDKTVKPNKQSQSIYDEDDGPRNYFSGQGEITCPACSTGRLRYSRAGYDCHVHARCSTENCVAWIE